MALFKKQCQHTWTTVSDREGWKPNDNFPGGCDLQNGDRVLQLRSDEDH